MGRRVLRILITAVVWACGPKGLHRGAEMVLLSNERPQGDCVFVGEVVGGQGNWWTDDITSTKSLVAGSRNDLKNKAYALGANYVHIQQVAQDSSYLGGGKLGMAGNAYKCK